MIFWLYYSAVQATQHTIIWIWVFFILTFFILLFVPNLCCHVFSCPLWNYNLNLLYPDFSTRKPLTSNVHEYAIIPVIHLGYECRIKGWNLTVAECSVSQQSYYFNFFFYKALLCERAGHVNLQWRTACALLWAEIQHGNWNVTKSISNAEIHVEFYRFKEKTWCTNKASFTQDWNLELLRWYPFILTCWNI